MACPNCAHPAPDRWCPRCGQRQHPDGWAVKQIFWGWVELWSLPLRPVFRLPGTLFPPGAATLDIVEGRRQRWPNPLAAYLGMLGFVTAVYSLLAPADSLTTIFGAELAQGLGSLLWLLESLRVALSVVLRYAVFALELPLLAVLTRGLLGPHPRGPSGPWVLALHGEIAALVVTAVVLMPLLSLVAVAELMVVDPETLRLLRGGAGALTLIGLPVASVALAVWCGAAARRSFGSHTARAAAFGVVFTAVVVVVGGAAAVLELGMQALIMLAALLLA